MLPVTKTVNLSLKGSRTDGQLYVSTYSQPEHNMPPAYRWRGHKKKEKEEEDGGGAAEVSDFFYKESKSKKK